MEAANTIISVRDRARLGRRFQFMGIQKRQEILKEMKLEQGEVRKKFPFSNWTQFLQYQAEQGNEAALDMLRARSALKKEQAVDWKWEQYQSRQNRQITRMDKNRLISQIKVRELAEREKEHGWAPVFGSAKIEVSKRGTVVIHIPGGELRDMGDKVTFRGNVKQAAESFARQKWGPGMKFEHGAFIRLAPEVLVEMDKLKATKTVDKSDLSR